MLENNGFFGKTMGFFWENNVFLKSNVFDTSTSHMIWFNYKAYTFYQNKNYSYFYTNFLFITQSLIKVTVLKTMLFKNFDKFSSGLHFSTLKLLFFSCRKSLRFFSAHILKLCVFPQKWAWKTQNADQKLSLCMILYCVCNTKVLYVLSGSPGQRHKGQSEKSCKLCS